MKVKVLKTINGGRGDLIIEGTVIPLGKRAEILPNGNLKICIGELCAVLMPNEFKVI